MPRSLYSILKSQHPEISSKGIKALIRDGQARVNAVVVTEPAHLVPDESEAKLLATAQRASVVRAPLADRMRVVFEDDDVIVVDKAAGILVQPTEAREEGTLIELVQHYWRAKAHRPSGARQLTRGGSSYRSRPVCVVHRIDKDTSGLVVFAKNHLARQSLSQQFRAHTIERKYLALVEGCPVPSRGVIKTVIAPDRGDRRRGSVEGRTPGRPAITRYEVIERYARASLVSLRLETGRQHQIRIHLSEKGHPVIGEKVYAGSRTQTAYGHNRQALHAAALGFIHPRTGEKVKLESPLPSDLADLRERLLRTDDRSPNTQLAHRTSKAKRI